MKMMNQNFKDSFVYCWTDKATNKLYIGSHKGTIDDGYICSSKLMLQEYKTRSQDFSRQIIAEGQHEDIRKLEEKLLDSLNVKHDPLFYNQHNGNGKFYLKGQSNISRKKISLAKMGNKNPMFGKKVSAETKIKCSAASKKRIITPEFIEKSRMAKLGTKNPNFGNPNSAKHLNNSITCIKCRKTMNGGNYYRYHDIKCS